MADFIKLVEDVTPFNSKFLGLKVVTCEKSKLVCELKMKEEFIGRRDNKVLHGGIAAAAIDHVGGFASWTALDDRHTMLSTVDLRIDYITPAPYETLLVIGQVVSVSKQLIRADVTVQTKSGTVIAIGRGLYNCYKGGIDMRAAMAGPAFSTQDESNCGKRGEQ